MARGTNAHDLDALTHTWMPGVAGSTPVARRGLKNVSIPRKLVIIVEKVVSAHFHCIGAH